MSNLHCISPVSGRAATPLMTGRGVSHLASSCGAGRQQAGTFEWPKVKLPHSFVSLSLPLIILKIIFCLILTDLEWEENEMHVGHLLF